MINLEKQRKYFREYYRRRREDPEYAAREKEYQRQYYQKRCAEDPTFRERQTAAERERRRRCAEEITTSNEKLKDDFDLLEDGATIWLYPNGENPLHSSPVQVTHFSGSFYTEENAADGPDYYFGDVLKFNHGYTRNLQKFWAANGRHGKKRTP